MYKEEQVHFEKLIQKIQKPDFLNFKNKLATGLK